MKYGSLYFKTIDFDKHSEIAIKFRADSYSISFGANKDFFEEDGLGGQRYIEQLKKTNKNNVFHIWLKNEIIGQVELGLYKNDKNWGYINLYYLKNEFRGKGYSKYLDDFAIDFLKGFGVNKAKLSVSPNNIRAIKFYEKNGWEDKGLRPFKDHTLPHVLHFMEKTF